MLKIKHLVWELGALDSSSHEYWGITTSILPFSLLHTTAIVQIHLYEYSLSSHTVWLNYLPHIFCFLRSHEPSHPTKLNFTFSNCSELSQTFSQVKDHLPRKHISSSGLAKYMKMPETSVCVSSVALLIQLLCHWPAKAEFGLSIWA